MSEQGGTIYAVKTEISAESIGGMDFVGKQVNSIAPLPLNNPYWEDAWTGDTNCFCGAERSILFVPKSNPSDPFTIDILSSSLRSVSIHRCRIEGQSISYPELFYVQGRNPKLRALVHKLLNEAETADD
jgi:hypothetical protein